MSQLHRPCSSTSAFCLIRSNSKSERARTCNEQQKKREQRQETKKARRRNGKKPSKRAKSASSAPYQCKYFIFNFDNSPLSHPSQPFGSVCPLLHQILYHFRRRFLCMCASLEVLSGTDDDVNFLSCVLPPGLSQTRP
jgi:hypothetical protein